MKIKNILEGKHNKESFRYENGKLQMFGRIWDKGDIQTLVETANLLKLEGHDLKVPTGTKDVTYDGLLGGVTINVKTYDEADSEDE